MTIVNDIRAALDVKLADIADLPAIAFENAPFDQVAGTPHLRTSFFVTSRRPSVTGPNPQHRYQGLYRVVVATPTEQGTMAAFDYADKLLGEFNGHTYVNGPSVTLSIEYSELGGQVFSEPFFLLPVLIAWYCYEY